MQIRIPNLALVGCLILFASMSFAGGNNSTLGVEAAVEATSQAFASPALPSLDGEKFVITPLYGTVKVEAVDSSEYVEEGTTSNNTGSLKGQIAGLTLSYSGKGNWGLFFTAAGTQVKGDMTSTIYGYTTYINDIDASGTLLTTGVSYRLFGDAKSFFAMGLFAGPAYMSVKAKETVVRSDGQVVHVELDPRMSGPYFGFQMMFRPWKFRINPYMNGFADTSEHCRDMQSDGDVIVPGQVSGSTLCRNGKEGTDIDGTLMGVGLNLGFGNFLLNVGSFASGTRPYLKATSTAFSYGFSF